MAFKYAEAFIELSLKDDAALAGLRNADDLLTRLTSSTAGFSQHLQHAANAGTELSRGLGGVGNLLSDVLTGFATGGAAGAGFAAMAEVIPLITDSVSKMGEVFGFSNKNIIDHAKALEIAAARARDYAEAAKDAQQSWQQFQDRLQPGESEPLRDSRKSSVDKALDDQNAAIGRADQRIKDIRSGKQDEELRQRILGRLNGLPATDEQMKQQMAKERASEIEKQRKAIAEMNERRDELIWQQFQEREQSTREDDQRRELSRFGEDAEQERGLRAAAEAERKSAINEENKRRLREQAGTFVPRGQVQERFPGLGPEAASFRLGRGGIEGMHSAIQQGIAEGESLRLQKEAAEAAKNANKLLEDVNKNAAKMVDKLDKLNIQGVMGP